MDWDKIYKDQYGRLFSFCKSVLKDESDAEEAVNETFARAADKIDQWKGSSDKEFNNWIGSIAYNTSKDKLRTKTHHRPQYIYIEDLEGFEIGTSESPLNILEYEEKERILWNLVNETTGAPRMIFLTNWSLVDISKKTGIPIGTIKSSSSRTKQKIKRKMEQLLSS